MGSTCGSIDANSLRKVLRSFPRTREKFPTLDTERGVPARHSLATGGTAGGTRRTTRDTCCAKAQRYKTTSDSTRSRGEVTRPQNPKHIPHRLRIGLARDDKTFPADNRRSQGDTWCGGVELRFGGPRKPAERQERRYRCHGEPLPAVRNRRRYPIIKQRYGSASWAVRAPAWRRVRGNDVSFRFHGGADFIS